MINPVIGAIKENMKEIQIIFDETVEEFKKDRKNTGDSKEFSVNEFIERFLPSSFNTRKGRIYNMESSSNEIDCVILGPNHPLLITPKRKVIIAEGVFAAIEVKPDISTLTRNSEFNRSLIQIQSVKKLSRRICTYNFSKPYDLKPYTIPSIIFSKTCGSLEDTTQYMISCNNHNYILSEEIPDIVLSLDKGIIYHSMNIEKSILSDWVKDKNIIGEIYLCIYSDKSEDILSLFIFLLLSLKPAQPLLNDFIIKDYLNSGFSGNMTYTIIKPVQI